jgi:hypothetical protein
LPLGPEFDISMVSSAILLEDAMKITTHIDEALLKRAKQKTGIVSQREVLETGLRNLLADIQRKSFVKDFDKFRLDLSLKSLKESRG